MPGCDILMMIKNLSLTNSLIADRPKTKQTKAMPGF